MPPLQALVALHGLWVLVLVPCALWGVRKLPASRLRIIGLTLMAAGLGPAPAAAPDFPGEIEV